MTRSTTCHNLGDSVPYRHKEQAQRIADDGLILRVATGSTVHGTALDDRSDRDEVGVCIEPRPYVIGLGNFQQYTFRTQPEGVPSGPGDLDLTVYCHDPYSLVLTADLRWRMIHQLRVGDRVISFDENAPTRNRHRHFSTGTVTATQRRMMERVRVETSEGPTIVTPDHAFLVRFASDPYTRWVKAKDLQPGHSIYYMKPWVVDSSWKAGYLAGQFDGDGSLHFTKTGEHSGVSQLSWAQKSGRPDVAYVEELLSDLGFKTRTHGPGKSGCDYVYVGGDWSEQMRFLGTVRPQRLLRHPELDRLWSDRSLQTCTRATVEAVVPLPMGPMIAMEVDAHTYIADGFLTHNSLRKYVRLILDGNPSILTLLYTPAEHILFSTGFGQELMRIREWAISRLAGARFLGYMQAQAKRIDNNLRRDQEAPEGDERFAYKPKMAGHYVRLAVQGVELLTTGELTLPMPEPHAEFVRELKRGDRTWAEAQEYAADYEQKLLALRESSTALAPSPPWTQANRWLVDTYERYWGRYP